MGAGAVDRPVVRQQALTVFNYLAFDATAFEPKKQSLNTLSIQHAIPGTYFNGKRGVLYRY